MAEKSRTHVSDQQRECDASYKSVSLTGHSLNHQDNCSYD
jgi:hypothetical protein